MQQLTFLGLDAVDNLTGVAHRDLLIPPCISHGLLPFERIELRHRYIQVGQGQIDGRIAHVLVQVHCSEERHSNTGECGVQ